MKLMGLRSGVVGVACAVALFSTAQSATIYVDVNCPGPGDGSIANPYCSIQTAIDNAVDTDEIIVAPGTYFEAINFNGKAITLRSSDGPEVTIIDGTGFFHVVQCVSGEGPDTVLDGFVITGGNANGQGLLDARGGGMLNRFGSSPTVTSCTFSGNSADHGGGMANFSSSPTVTGCIFSGNSSDGGAGGSGGGGGMSNLDSSPTVVNCMFGGNSATATGGGMDNDFSSPTVTNCTFTGNSADGGGGMYNRGGSPTVTNCTFISNDGIIGGGMNNTGSNPPVTNCTFSGNTAFGGGGMFNVGSSPTVTNCTFSGNTAIFGGMFNNNSSPPVTNCILWNNGPDEFSGTGTPAVTYSNIQGGWPGTGNIDADPLFVDPDNGDLRLQAGSPCIDAGDNTAVPEGIDTDLDGNPRFLEIPETPDTGNGTLPIVDMGAYESLGGGCLAVTSQEVVCHADGTTFTVNIEGLNACTGGTTQVTVTASGGAVGEELCFTALVNDGGFCCSTEICVTIPDCMSAADCNNNGILDAQDIADGTSPDCNANGIPDECDLADGTSPDVNGSGIPDECECLADINGTGSVDITDFLQLLAVWGPCEPGCFGDVDFDGNVGITDFLALLAAWGPCP